MPTIPLNLLAFLSEWLALRMAKKEWHAVILVHKDGISIPPGHTPRSGVLRQQEFLFFTRCLAGFLLYWQLSPRSTAPCSANFIGTQPGDFAKGLKSAVVARRNRLLSCNSETV